MISPSPTSPLFPYTTLFRSGAAATRGFGQSVHEAVNVPGGGVSDWAAVGAEVVGTFTLAFIIFEMVSSRRWMRWTRSEEHTSELQSRQYLVCRLLLEKKKTE